MQRERGYVRLHLCLAYWFGISLFETGLGSATHDCKHKDDLSLAYQFRNSLTAREKGGKGVVGIILS